MSIQNSTFQRSQHNKQNPYVMIDRDLIRDNSISPVCRWLLIYLLSHRDDWVINVSQLIQFCKGNIGQKKLYKTIKEAQDKGYIFKEISFEGNLKRIRYFVFETSQESRLGTFRHVEESPCPKGATKKEHTEDITLEEIPIPAVAGSAPFAENPKNSRDFGTNPRALGTNPRKLGTNPGKTKDKKEVAQFVKVTQIQEDSLLKKANDSKELLDSWYKALSEWKIGKGINDRPNDYTAITRWVIKAVEEKANQKSSIINKTEVHKALAEQVKLTYPNHRAIQIGYNYIEFKMGRMGVPDPLLRFGDFGFEEQVENHLRKLGLQAVKTQQWAVV